MIPQFDNRPTIRTADWARSLRKSNMIREPLPIYRTAWLFKIPKITQFYHLADSKWRPDPQFQQLSPAYPIQVIPIFLPNSAGRGRKSATSLFWKHVRQIAPD